MQEHVCNEYRNDRLCTCEILFVTTPRCTCSIPEYQCLLDWDKTRLIHCPALCTILVLFITVGFDMIPDITKFIGWKVALCAFVLCTFSLVWMYLCEPIKQSHFCKFYFNPLWYGPQYQKYPFGFFDSVETSNGYVKWLLGLLVKREESMIMSKHCSVYFYHSAG